MEITDTGLLAYMGPALLGGLLLLLEIKCGSGRTLQGIGYEYYLPDKRSVRVRQMFGPMYRIYVFDACPVPTRHDRYGNYFPLSARSAQAAEAAIEDIYRTARRGGSGNGEEALCTV